jgi:predicted nucleic acid-binding Zn ribbon protein
MATYVYETIPADPAQPRRRFEVQQSMKDTPLSRDPQTGEPVRRVISGGYGFVGSSKGETTPAKASPGGGCGHGSCGCGHAH